MIEPAVVRKRSHTNSCTMLSLVFLNADVLTRTVRLFRRLLLMLRPASLILRRPLLPTGGVPRVVERERVAKHPLGVNPDPHRRTQTNPAFVSSGKTPVNATARTTENVNIPILPMPKVPVVTVPAVLARVEKARASVGEAQLRPAIGILAKSHVVSTSRELAPVGPHVVSSMTLSPGLMLPRPLLAGTAKAEDVVAGPKAKVRLEKMTRIFGRDGSQPSGHCPSMRVHSH